MAIDRCSAAAGRVTPYLAGVGLGYCAGATIAAADAAGLAIATGLFPLAIETRRGA